ncbi:phosphoenolpyruvate synthase [Fictibacillus macauensis ZFHKF-1]|uniref:Rifampicin phosphotransferase n=1 Tax=Fictibacillus macauensis ZFHKF-1 TaxID=1196324 RepID=I8UIP7_9BACL|nr:phosphoenolpyruvate synthase [Fictibacillus macauensis]EIT86708.1 phosphoenolpyruvate synthase [Fictibacillus macauensis ZFHKF-1]
MNAYVVDVKEVEVTHLMQVGGKALRVGELSKMQEIQVPEGFCVTTLAYQKVIEQNEAISSLVHKLMDLTLENQHSIRELSREIRQKIMKTTIPSHLVHEVTTYLSKLGEEHAYAVRSSATAEDSPHASFAGQHDTYLNTIGKESILHTIRKCWASLFTERAVMYRIMNEFDHNKMYISVLVQKMIPSDASGILFTADPMTGNRKILSIDASFGLGEALVSGMVSADGYQVKDEAIINKRIEPKKRAIYGREGGGTETVEITSNQQMKQALTDEQILRLAKIGRRIEAHFGCPQDIEWCLAADTFYIVQSRPITTLYPTPEANDQENHVYVSVGHQQMMTDPIKPLGISIWTLTGGQPMFKVSGGRLFVDITMGLKTSAGRENLLGVLGHSDPLIKDALVTIIERDFIKLTPGNKSAPGAIKSHKGMSSAAILAEAGNDPDIVDHLMKSSETSLATLKQTIQAKSGVDVFACILDDMQQRRQRASDLNQLGVIMAPIHASAWINEHMNDWLGEKNVADTLSLSVPNNITSEMGLELLDVADLIRPYPDIVHFLQEVKKDHFFDELVQLQGGRQVREAIAAFLDKYGMRCAGEIDITRTRWHEKPSSLIPMILSNIKNVAPGERKRKFEKGRKEAIDKERELLARLHQLPDGEKKAAETKQMIDLLRKFIGFREYPKYDIVSRYFVYKKALLKEAEQLVEAGIIHEKEDMYYLTFQELQEAVRTYQLDRSMINKRKEAYTIYEKQAPPRIITSDGEIISGQYNRENVPDHAMVGLAVSSGVVEGRARVILKVEDAHLEEGDILVTAFTDPSWTPLFCSVKGLVTEVGGLMTHGAVIAREYGLPAVVGVEDATKRIKDGQRIRIHGTEGYIEIV